AVNNAVADRQRGSDEPVTLGGGAGVFADRERQFREHSALDFSKFPFIRLSGRRRARRAELGFRQDRSLLPRPPASQARIVHSCRSPGLPHTSPSTDETCPLPKCRCKTYAVTGVRASADGMQPPRNPGGPSVPA